MEHRTHDAHLWSAISLGLSALLALISPALYYLGTNQVGRTASLSYEAAFHLYLALLFFGTNRWSPNVAIFAILRWACESWATFGRAYRTRFFGTLFLFAFLATLFELVMGRKVTQYFGAAAI